MLVEGLTVENIRASTDAQGFSVLEIDVPTPDLLFVLFEHDIQTIEDIDLLHHQVDSVVRGEINEFTFSGNSCTLTIRKESVTIENDILENDEQLEMSLEQYRVILDVWATHIIA